VAALLAEFFRPRPGSQDEHTVDKRAGRTHHRGMEKRLLTLLTALALALGLATGAQAAVRASVAAGTLTVTGAGAGERIALRLAPGSRVAVDVGDNGSAEFSFLRSSFTKIVVNGVLGSK
jgi:ferric-dicitrate binding protein FerR (iron transport regulator)